MALFARDREIAAHLFGQIFDDGEAEARAAVAPRDIGVGLGERTKQPLDLGRGETDAAVADGENDFDMAAFGARGLDASETGAEIVWFPYSTLISAADDPLFSVRLPFVPGARLYDAPL